MTFSTILFGFDFYLSFFIPCVAQWAQLLCVRVRVLFSFFYEE